MKSLKDIQQLSLHLILSLLRDAEEIQCLDLSSSKLWIQEQKFPDIIISLCKLGKRVESSLITGQYLDVSGESNLLLDVFPRQTGSVLPSFCYELFSQIFSESGRPRYTLAVEYTPFKAFLSVVDVDLKRDHANTVVAEKAASVVLLLRQILLLFSKAQDIDVVADQSVEIEDFTRRITTPVAFRYRPGLSVVFSYARMLLRELLCPEGLLHPSLAQWVDNPFGRHGPGAVASRERGREKWNFMYDCFRLPSLLYSDTYSAPIGNSDSDVDYYSRLCVVPKDFRGHRLICAEPKELQFAQQGLLKILEGILAGSRITNGHICLDDQMPSFFMSRHLKFGTIDLKDASDRITLRLLKILLPEEVYKLVVRFRSTGIILTDGTVLKQYNTAFTMGNALCFPMETLVFWALSLATIKTNAGSTPPLYSSFSKEDIDGLRRVPLRVFGDDIITPLEWVTPVSEILTAAGLVVNKDKTCELSLVRESCGSWWYAGRDCRITKLKFSSTMDLTSWIGFQDVIPQLRMNGLLNLANTLEAFCCDFYPTLESCRLLLKLRDKNPEELVLDDQLRQSWAIKSLHYFVRYNRNLQRMEYRSPRRETDNMRALPGRLGYLSWFTQAATRFLNTHTERVKFRWIELI